MKISKKILKSSAFQAVLCQIAYLYILFVKLTSKWEIKRSAAFDKIVAEKKPFIFAFWHGRLLMIAPFSPKHVKMNVLISLHNDGELITKVMEYFNFTMIRGSSKNQGMSALKEILRVVKKGDSVAITPDGPRGPRMRVGGNIAKIAQMLDVPVIPLTYSISNAKILRSWDRFVLAKPFGKGVFIYGEPVKITKEDSSEAARIKIENALNEITKEADNLVGITPIEPE